MNGARIWREISQLRLRPPIKPWPRFGGPEVSTG
jgi:hypothetical protein